MIATGSSIQDLFNTIAGHLLKQAQRSTFVGVACRYRGMNGMKCAVGIIITDEQYQVCMEGAGVLDIIPQVNASLGRVASKDELRMLVQLQSLHDNSYTSMWPVELKVIADMHRLAYTFSAKDEAACIATGK